MTYEINSSDYDQQTVSAGAGTVVIAHDTNKRCATITMEGAQTAGDYGRIRTHFHAPYTAGRSQTSFITGSLCGPESNADISNRMGYFDDLNGYFINCRNGALSLVERSSVTGSVVETSVAQASWNKDPLNGTGPSGITLDKTKSQILVIDLQALYAGRVRIYFGIGGKLIQVHEFLHANVIANPYLQMAGLPNTWETYCHANTTVTSMVQHAFCSTIFNEGGVRLEEIPGRVRSAGNGITAIGVTTRRPVFSIRPKATFNSLQNRSVIIPQSIFVTAKTNDAYVEIVRNGTLLAGGGAATWADVDGTFSSAQKNVNADTISGGMVLDTFDVVAGTGSAKNTLQKEFNKALLSMGADGSTLDTLSIVVTSFTGTSTVTSGISWKEIR